MDEKIKGHNTSELIIRYKDSDGNDTKRNISHINIEGRDRINAYCHMRNETRTFLINNIIYIVDPKTGNIDRNPWKYFGLSLNDNLQALVHPILPAVKTLKLFSILIRGFAKRERAYIINFITDHIGAENIGAPKIEEWLQKLWCAPCSHDEHILVYDFQKGDDFQCLKPLIKEIPDELMEKCRETALYIAKGSGRKPIPADLIDWINKNFSTSEEKENTDRCRVYVLKGKGIT
jgi:hypothetical protein